MDEARMAAILAAYGADPARWPEAERATAQAWMAAHGDRVADAHAGARAVDDALALDVRGAAPVDALATRVVQRIPGAGETVLPFGARAVSARARNAGAIAALAACAVLGVAIGFNAPGLSDDAMADADAAFGAAFGIVAERGPLGGGG